MLSRGYLVFIIILMVLFSIIPPTSPQETSQNSIPNEQTRSATPDKNIEYLCPSPPTEILDGAWRPDGSYAILVGNGIHIFDGENYELLNLDNDFRCVAWKPDNDLSDGYQGYALLAGYSLLKFDGVKFIELTDEISDQSYISKIAWKPDGSYALLFGTNFSYYGNHEILLKYDGEKLTDLTSKMGHYPNLYGLCWHPEGTYAIIVGTDHDYNAMYDRYYTPIIIEYDGNNFVELSNKCDFPGVLYDIAWKPDGEYALIVGMDYDDYSEDTPMIIQFEESNINSFSIDLKLVYRLDQITWHPKREYATIMGYGGQGGLIFNYFNQTVDLVTPEYGIFETLLHKIIWHPYGDYAIIPFDKWIYTGLYMMKDDELNIISKYMMGCDSGPTSLSWKSDGSYALIVGMQYYEERRGGRSSYYHQGRLWKFDGINVTNLSSMLISDEPLKKCSWQPNSSNAIIVGSYNSLFWYNEDQIIDITHKIGNPENIEDVEWNPNGETALVLTSNYDYDSYPYPYSGKIWEYNITTDNWTLLISNSTWYYDHVAWHPSGSHAIISSANEYDLCLVKYNNSNFTIIELDSDIEIIRDMEWKPDGTELTLIGPYDYNGIIVTYDGTTSTDILLDPNGYVYPENLVWSPDGSYALITSPYSMYRWENDNLFYLAGDFPFTSNFGSLAWYPSNGVNEKLQGSCFIAYQCGKILRYGNIKPKLITDFPIRKIEFDQVSYEFTAHYIDLENDAPATGYPKLNLYTDSDGTILYAGSPFVMSALDSTDNEMVDGKTFTKSLSLLDHNFNYSFRIEIKAATGDTAPVYSRLIRFSELDFDGDGDMNELDDFPYNRSEWLDSDGDGYGDNTDEFPDDPTEWKDTDGDGYGDNIDDFPDDPTEWLDADGDGYGDNIDEFPDDPSEWLDTDGDGYGDNIDKFPNNGSEWNDTDSDGIGDNADKDDDNDGYDDALELAEGTDPLNNNSLPQDFDNDLIPDSVDVDDDNDGYNDTIEVIEGTDQFDTNSTPPDLDADYLPDSIDPDIDGDDVLNEDDYYPYDQSKSEKKKEIDNTAILYSLIGIVIIIILFVVLFLFAKKQKQEKKDKKKEISPRMSLEPIVKPQEPRVVEQPVQPQQSKVPTIKTQPTIKEKNT